MTGRWALATALLLVAAACGDAGEPTAPPATEPATTAAAAAPTVALPAGWSAATVGEGVKPALALDGADQPALAWLREDLSEGFVAYAAAADGWEVDEFVEGYFYGPIGLAFDPDDRPHVVWHDHQANTFQPELGDLTHAVRTGSSWEIGPAEDDGHDGWDSTVAIGPDGVVRAAGVDPLQFDRRDGVEYYELGPDGWEVTAIGSGPIEYEWNVSLAVGPGGEPALTYFDQATQDLRFATRVDGTWQIETVAAESDVGRFSSLAFDREGRPHVSFLRIASTDQADVLYATRDADGWAVEQVSILTALLMEHVGARRSTAVAVAPDGSPLVAYADRGVVGLATRADGGSWEREVVLQAGDRPLGQLVTMAVAADGTTHLATYEVTNRSPLQGEIIYLTRN